MKKILVAAIILVGALALAQAVQKAYRLVINAKAYSQQAVVIGGKTFVPLEALKASGVSVALSGKTLSLGLSAPVQGGANQNLALEGCIGEWLFNGIWRFRVNNLRQAEGTESGTTWIATAELRNGSSFNNISLSGTGWGGMQLILENGNALPAISDAVDLRDIGVLQGAIKTVDVNFVADQSGGQPSKLILLLDPKGLAGTQMRYATTNPSFRVKLDCKK